MPRTPKRSSSRRSPSRSRRSKRLPPWLWVLIGLTVGACITWGVQRLFFQGPTAFTGLAGLFAEKPKAPLPTPKQPPTAAKPVPDTQTKKTPAAKPKFDFYTVLPGVETVIPERNTRQLPKPDVAKPEQGVVYVLQAASFATHEEADRLKAKLALAGLEAQIQKVAIEGKGEFHRVRLGPYKKIEDLDKTNQRLSELGIKALRLKVKAPAG